MKKIFLCLIALVIVTTLNVDAKTKTKTKKAEKTQTKTQKVVKNDVLKDNEYKELKTRYFQAEGYGETYNCQVEKQKFCKVKDLDTGMYVLCDRNVSRAQMESAAVFYKYGRCVKIN